MLSIMKRVLYGKSRVRTVEPYSYVTSARLENGLLEVSEKSIRRPTLTLSITLWKVTLRVLF